MPCIAQPVYGPWRADPMSGSIGSVARGARRSCSVLSAENRMRRLDSAWRGNTCAWRRGIMSKTSEKRKRLFDLFSANLSLYLPEHAGMFACPLCMYLFTRDDLTDSSPALTFAHYIPHFCGGKLGDCTLACAECNSGIGHGLES